VALPSLAFQKDAAAPPPDPDVTGIELPIV
jgi:hypothetical protein